MEENKFKFKVGDYVSFVEKDIMKTICYISETREIVTHRVDMDYLKGTVVQIKEQRCLPCLGINQYKLDKVHDWVCEDSLIRREV